jgi:hypothetical protein
MLFALASSYPTLSASARPISGRLEIAQTLTDSQTQAIKQEAENLLELLGKKDYQQVSNLISSELQKYWPPEKI